LDKEAPGYAYRTAKKRETDIVKASLPAVPSKKAAINKTIMNSPRTRQTLGNAGMFKMAPGEKEINILEELAGTISQGMEEVKQSRSNEKLSAFTTFRSLAFGQMLRKQKQKISLENFSHPAA